MASPASKFIPNNMSTLSVAIATFNESKNIARCLDAINQIADEIIIVDGKSTDNTLAILKRYPKVKVISTENKTNFHLNKQMAIDNCHSDWILQLDADEVVTTKLAREISRLLKIKDNTTLSDGYWIKRKNYFLGRFLTKGGVYPDPTIRLYRNGKGHLPCLSVHEQAVIEGNVGQLKHDLLHYADYSFSRYLLRNNRYTTLIAQEFMDHKLPINIFSFVYYFFVKPLYWFCLSYLLHRGYVDGFPGFVFAWYSSFRFPLAYIKYYELSLRQTGIDISRDWN